MLYYPQLSSGAITQYPARRTSGTRTVVNEMPDGSFVKLADPDATDYQWELQYSGLSDGERETLEQFFLEAGGRLKTFTFVDPIGNGLRWSEDLSASVWRKDGMISIAGQEELIRGGRVSRITNAGQMSQGLEQTVSAPAQMVWCLSAFVKSNAPTLVRCKLQNADAAIDSLWTAVPEWTQVWCSGALPGSAGDLTARFEFEGGSTLDIGAMQLQAQPRPGQYARTTAANGLFAFTRFDSDVIEFRANGADDHSVTVFLRSRGGGE